MEGSLEPGDRRQPSVRASDGDRERVATLLRDGYADGRLTFDELQERLDRAYNSTTMGDLATLTQDLPARTASTAEPTAKEPSISAAAWRRKRDRVLGYVVLMVFLIAVWAVTGHGSFWPIWPILVGGLIVARDVLGLSHGSGDAGRDQARQARHEARQRYREARHQDRLERRYGSKDDSDESD